MAKNAASAKSARAAAARAQPRHHATGRFLPVAIPAQASRSGSGGGGLVAAAGAARTSGTVRRSGGR